MQPLVVVSYYSSNGDALEVLSMGD